MNKKQYIESQKDCAKLLEQSFFNYKKSLKNIKCSKFEKELSEEKDSNNILKELGLGEKDLKKIC